MNINVIHFFVCFFYVGGALASMVYSFLWHGDPRVSALSSQVLSAACAPLYTMLTDWLLDGEIKDPSQEFFIEALPNISGDRLWHQKYRVRLVASSAISIHFN